MDNVLVFMANRKLQQILLNLSNYGPILIFSFIKWQQEERST